jgi:hypothetical protein
VAGGDWSFDFSDDDGDGDDAGKLDYNTFQGRR